MSMLNEYGNITHTRTCAAAIAEFFRFIEEDRFYGVGLNDTTIAGTFTGHTPLNFIAKITTAAATDKFDWSDDGGATWTEDVAMTGAPQTLSEGVTIDYNASTGHTLGDEWKWQAFCIPESNISSEVFTGSGLDDLTPSGTYFGGGDLGIRVRVSTAAATDKFQWTRYPFDPNSWSDEIDMTGGAQAIVNGLLITFGATTGHTLGEYWEIECTATHGVLMVNSITGQVTTAGASADYISAKDEKTGDVFWHGDVTAVGELEPMSQEHNPVILEPGSDVSIDENAGGQVTELTVSAYLRFV